MNQMLKPSETRNKAVLVHHSPNNSIRTKIQAGQHFFALLHHSPACTPCHKYDQAESEGTYFKRSFLLFASPSPAFDNYTKLLHGSAISNAKQHSSHDRIDHHTSTNEGKNEGLPGLTTSALQ